MGSILVTGASGTLGEVVLDRLLDGGCAVRAVSRRERSAPSVEWIRADLARREGLDAVLDGVDAVIHCASTPGSKEADLRMTRNLVDAARGMGTPHLVHVSIVGVDRIPLGYYRTKLAVERMIEESGLGFSIQRATQFHDLVFAVLRNLARSPIVPVLAGTSVQPIDVHDVADRLVRVATEDPVGMMPDMGGPQVRTVGELTGVYLRAAGKRRRLLPVRLPGKIARGYREGGHLAPDLAVGEIGFEDYLERRLGTSGSA